jgi:hypothetical protein
MYVTDAFLIDIAPKWRTDPWEHAETRAAPPYPMATPAWINRVLPVFVKITMSQAGNALLASMRASNKWILVVGMAHDRDCSARGIATPGEWRDGGKRHYKGLVEFDPERFTAGSQCYRHKELNETAKNRGGRPDEILFHELVHAHRGALRLRNDSALQPSLRFYTNAEEFLAVVITNVYISDVSNRDKSGLRRDHWGKLPLEKELSDSVGFFASDPQVLTLLEAFSREQPKFFNDLADVVAEFNPFYALKHFKSELLNMSADYGKRRAAAIAKEKRPRPTGLPGPTPADYKAVLSKLAREALAALKRDR